MEEGFMTRVSGGADLAKLSAKSLKLFPEWALILWKMIFNDKVSIICWIEDLIEKFFILNFFRVFR